MQLFRFCLRSGAQESVSSNPSDADADGLCGKSGTFASKDGWGNWSPHKERNLAECPLNPDFWSCSHDVFNGSLSQTRTRLGQNRQAKYLATVEVGVALWSLMHSLTWVPVALVYAQLSARIEVLFMTLHPSKHMKWNVKWCFLETEFKGKIRFWNY